MFSKRLYKAILFVAAIIVECSCNYPQIRMPVGTVRGRYKISDGGQVYESYEGVPYALPPIGERRFEPPQPIFRWPTDINGTAPGNPCTQYNFFADAIFGDEDCVYLNIYKPSEKIELYLPIIIGIHGGGFQFGQGVELGPKYIMDKDVIFITFNHRLGPLGFLSTNDEIISGNMGLKDQSLVLLWVHENSNFFGGDAHRITLIGISAGAASVQYHYLSTMSKGLFRNGISLSGTALAPWGFSQNPLLVLKILLEKLSCPNGNSVLIAKCLKNLPANELYNATRIILSKFKFPYFLYLPVAERVTNNFFIDRSPEEILKSGHVYDAPWITGVVSEEGLYSFAGLLVNDDLTKYINDNWYHIIPYMVYLNEFTGYSSNNETADLIRANYFENNTFKGNLDDIKSLAHLIGDSTFLTAGEKAARLQAGVNKNPVRFYSYNYRGAYSISDTLANTTENLGVCHADDAFSVFQIDALDPRSTARDKAMSIELLNFWYSMASQNSNKMLNDWPKVNSKSEEFVYLKINGPNELLVERSKNFGNKLFWTSIGF